MTLDRLSEYGVTEMDDEEIRAFLANQRSGILGLPGDEAPYLVPLSYGYDDDSRLYFTYVVGAGSRKRDLSDRADAARFLVYSVSSAFVWESVLLRGTVEEVPRERWSSLEGVLADAWRPDLFESAAETEAVSVYRFDVEERRGIKHAGLPPGLEGLGSADDG